MIGIHAVKATPPSEKDEVSYPIQFNIKHIELINKDFPYGNKLYIFDVNFIQAIRASQDPDVKLSIVYLSNGEEYRTTMPHEELIQRMAGMKRD